MRWVKRQLKNKYTRLLFLVGTLGVMEENMHFLQPLIGDAWYGVFAILVMLVGFYARQEALRLSLTKLGARYFTSNGEKK